VAKLTALGMSINVDDSGGTARDITNDVGSLQFNTSGVPIDVSGLDVTGFERLLGRRDTTLTLNGFYNPASNKSHDVFKTVLTQVGTVTRTVTLGWSTGTVSGEMIAVSYNRTVNSDGSQPWTAELQATGGTVPTWS